LVLSFKKEHASFLTSSSTEKNPLKTLTLIAAAVLALLAGPVTGRSEEPIRVGAVNPYSGPLAQFGDEVARGYELATEAVNAKGGIAGRKIVLVRGDAGTPQQGIATIDKLVSQDKCDVFVGTYISAVSNAASDAAARYGKVYWDTHALAADLTERGLANFFRAGPSRPPRICGSPPAMSPTTRCCCEP